MRLLIDKICRTCIEMKLVFILLMLLGALFGAVYLLLTAVPDFGNDISEVIQGMVLTAITGVITSLIGAIVLVVKGIVDSEKDRAAGGKNSTNQNEAETSDGR